MTSSQRARQKAETRRRLLEAATAVFLESGPIAASLDTVAARAGVSKATLFFHFGNRTELMAQLARYLYRRATGPETGWGVTGDLRRFLEEFLRAQARPEVRLIWQLGDMLAADDPEGLSATYWHLVEEIERRLGDAGLEPEPARERALVLAPALMLTARRVTFGHAPPDEASGFVDAACRLVLS